jgi:flagellum-specific peptidoglycan hydrolase FlgJ
MSFIDTAGSGGNHSDANHYSRVKEMQKHEHTKHPIHNTVKLKAVHNPEYLKFIDAAAGPAQSSELQTGVPASITIAQGILEPVMNLG